MRTAPDAADCAEFSLKLHVVRALSMSARRQIYNVLRETTTNHNTMILAIGMTLGEICTLLVLSDQV